MHLCPKLQMMIVFPVLIPGQNFLFPGTGREITKCHGKGNLRLVFPGITGHGIREFPLTLGGVRKKIGYWSTCITFIEHVISIIEVKLT